MQSNLIHDFIEEISSNLYLTIRWTEHLQHNYPEAGYLHSKIFRHSNPDYKGGPFYSYDHNGFPIITINDYFDYHEVFAKALLKRNNIEHNIQLENPNDFGKILLFETEVTTNDGVTTFNTNGFIDDWDVPPIDCWFFLARSYWCSTGNLALFSWIPKAYIPIMQEGIDVEILGSYAWLQDVDQDLNDRLLRHVASFHP